MATAVIMPRQGQSVESCVITSWNKKVGDSVKVGDVLFSYETDKSSFDEVSTVEGTMLAILREDGDDVPCLENVCVIGNEGEDISEFTASAAAEASAPEESVKEATATAEVTEKAPEAATGVLNVEKISPRAKLLAEKTNADLLKAVPTGPNGRIIERDVRTLLENGYTVSSAARDEYKSAVEGTGISGRVVTSDLEAKAPAAAPAQEAKATEPEYTDVPLSNVRKVIAKSMHASLSNMAQLTLNTSFDATKLQAIRASIKANGEKMGIGNITLNDMILFAVAKTVGGFKDINAHYLDDKNVIRYFSCVNLGIAVDTDRGLLVPTLMNADKMSLNELSKNAKAVITEAQSGNISPDKLRGATFTITNLGSLGIESFTPVINPPQTAILGVNNITKRIKEVNGEDVTYPAMGLSLTFDHRALDGAPAAKFLKALCANLENFDLLMIK
ncbi:MAG: 2-oxo acid dehydrogenase subunit E2 [Ruminococcaceae bacterium]|nr:2-oxo acid dehydrogenase subunit E2 [Oscillospiraceae bacterium]